MRILMLMMISLMVVTVNGVSHKNASKDTHDYMLQFLLTQLETMESRMLSTIDGRMHQLQKSIEERLGIIEKKTKRVLRRLRNDSICPENDAGTVVNEETSTVRTMDQFNHVFDTPVIPPSVPLERSSLDREKIQRELLLLNMLLQRFQLLRLERLRSLNAGLIVNDEH
uniref:Uncharacterized protein n=1 Tax=Anopheles atroparvus TaxID=41427 RepID=A0AAG5DMV3_ANOAO